MSRYKPTRRAVLGASAAITTVCAGCLGGSDDGGSDSFRIGSPWTPESLDPTSGDSVLKRIGITETLVGVGYDANVSSALAESWHEVDTREWTFDLRTDVAFHDGTSLTADAVVTSLERAFDDSGLASVPVESITAIDEETVEIHTDTPFSPLPAHLTRPETAIVAPGATDEDGLIHEPIATGPFVFDDWEPDANITAVKNDDYYGTVPTIERARYEGITDDRTRRLKLENGELDMARILPPSDVDALESNDELVAHTYPIPRSRYLVFDTESPPFDDVECRRAILYATDRETIVDTLLEGITTPAVGPFSSAVTDWANDDLDPYDDDPDRARAKLEAAGWTASDDGPRTRDGNALEIDIWTYSSRPVLPRLAEVLQDQLEDVGFAVDVEVMDTGTITDRTRNESFDAFIWSNSLLWYPDPDRLTDLFHSTDATMHGGYENTRVDDLLAEGRKTVDRAERKAIYDEIQTIVHDEVPIAFLTDYTNVVATTGGVDGYEPHPIESTYGLETVSQ